ncbi:MAG: peptidase S8, partial [Actinobacteria bacterium]|nr:peptidase S8 [Actinomycetota bacterium]
MKKRLVGPVLIPLMALSLTAFTQVPLAPADDRPDRELPASISDLKLDSPVSATDVDLIRLDTSLRGVSGDQRVVVRLAEPAVAEQNLSAAAAAKEKKNLRAAQNALVKRAKTLDSGLEVLAQTQVVLNAIFVEADAAMLEELAKDPAVERIAPVGNYELDLSETVPYIGATDVQESGYDGSGIKVAVLDSGIDYLHAALGGSGDPAEFAANDPDIIEPGSFPTAKVVGGYDFVGSEWTGADATPESPDPDPLDDGDGGGHGTHVADIIGGEYGVAPGVDLYAVKVCSSLSTACSGIALIEGMDYALDPNGDGKLSDRVDIINMSLGSSYGQPFDDDLSAAVENATKAGVLTVASAGNSGDKPYA